MKVAIPSNDSINIFKRTGQAKKFTIAEINGSDFSIVDAVFNKHTHEHGEDHHHDENGHSHDDLFESIEGCKHIIVNVVGKQLKSDLEKNNIGIFKTKEITVDDGILDFVAKNIIK